VGIVRGVCLIYSISYLTPNAIDIMPIKHYPITILLLGFGGTIPFFVPAALVYFNPEHVDIWQSLLWNYGAVILSFVGALHWAFAMFAKDLSERDQTIGYIWSVTPALVAWVAITIECPAITPWMLALGFIAQLIQDWRWSFKIPFPHWFIPLRIQLTSVAVISVLASGLAGT
jgi:hypothetical protein